MFTTGSKLFIGASVVSIVTALVFGISTDGDIAWTATIGLIGASMSLLFLMGVNFYVRDGNVGAMHGDATTTSPAATRAPGRSMWPAIAAFGGALIAVGVVSAPIVFKAGLIVVAASIIEWMIQAWSERASADPAYNAAVRKRLLNPIEFPVLGAVGLTVIIYSLSRIFLFASKEAGPAVFIVAAALVLLAGFLIAAKASVQTSVIAGICTIATLGLVTTGAAMAIDGERPIHEHPTTSDEDKQQEGLCGSNEEDDEVDHKASQSLAAKSNVAATVYYEDGKLYAQVIGLQALQTKVTMQRSLPSHVVFRNLSDEHVRLTASLGSFKTDSGTYSAPTLACTTVVEPDGRQFLTLTYPKSSAATAQPYTLFVPEVEGAVIQVVVP
jgi:hypothetical protein